MALGRAFYYSVSSDSIMSSNQGTNVKADSGLRKVAYLSALIGGGVVGSDYGIWLGINPLVGALLGSALSAFLTKFLLGVQDDPGGKIKEICTTSGATLGGLIGPFIGLSHFGGAGGFFGGIMVGAIVGAIAGQLIAALISFGAFALLFISRGPVGFFLRKIILHQNEESSHLLDYLDTTYDLFSYLATMTRPLQTGIEVLATQVAF